MNHAVPEAIRPDEEPSLWQVVSPEGTVNQDRWPRGLDGDGLLTMYRTMSLVRTLDERMQILQRQGRISFYGAATGQEGAVIGSGYATEPNDWILPALREGGVALLRGFPLSDYINQVFCNGDDIQQGRQMPCHYGDNRVNYVTLSSNLGTQLPHAVGVALAQRLKGDTGVTIAYLGDGCTSESDFHVAMEFAAVMNVPVIFICQNNQWAISTPWQKQTAASSIAIKGCGYGMPGYRVDGNDAVAVYAVTKMARDRAVAGQGPCLIEAFTYRIGAHSTSDDPTRYRDESITEEWRLLDPIDRLRNLLVARKEWTDVDEEAMLTEYETQIRAEIKRAEAAPGPTLDSLFNDVYAHVPWHLEEQKRALELALTQGKTH